MIRLASLVFILLISAVSGNAQWRSESELSAAVEKLRSLMIDPNKAELNQIVADGLSYGHSSGRVEGKESFIESLVSAKSDFVSIDLTDQTSTIHGKTAIVRHVLSAKTNDGGQPGTVKIAVLLVWQKHRKQWKLIARQAVRI